jgi:site-specific DNA-methyltransferase (cytosine-N4-specific)
MLTDPSDLVVDIFGGSNTTGYVAEVEGRRWLTFEADSAYVAASAFRFLPSDASEQQLKETYETILTGRTVDLSVVRPAQTVMFG